MDQRAGQELPGAIDFESNFAVNETTRQLLWSDPAFEVVVCVALDAGRVVMDVDLVEIEVEAVSSVDTGQVVLTEEGGELFELLAH